MNWSLFAVLGVLATVLDANGMAVLRIERIWPLAAPTLVVFVALWASRPAALWGAFLLGLFADLSRPEIALAASGEMRSIRVLGPDALGWLFGAYALLPLRRVLLRRNPFAIAAATLAFLILASLVWGAIWSIRGAWAETVMPWTAGHALEALWERLLQAAYSAVLAVPIAWCLLRTMRLWGFPGTVSRW